MSSSSLISPQPASAPGGTASDIWTVLKDYADQSKNVKYNTVMIKAVKELSTAPKDTESTLVVLGSRQSGKTSILQKLFDRGDNLNATTALEYSFVRRTKPNNNIKDLLHVWELADIGTVSELLNVPVSAQKLHQLCMVVVVDLAKPETILTILERGMVAISSLIESLFQDLEKRGSKRPVALRSQALKRYGDQHPDKVKVKLIPLPLVIVANKYDQMMSMETEKQKLLGKFLRWTAHLYGANLIFNSNDDFATTKTFLQHLLFRTAPPLQNIQMEYLKPLFIPAGVDQFDSIGIPKSVLQTVLPHQLKMSDWKGEMERHFPPSSHPTSSEDLNKYIEPLIDDVLQTSS